MKNILRKLKSAFVPGEKNQFRPPVLGEKNLLFYALCLVVLKIAVLLIIFYFPQTDLFSVISGQTLVSLINQERTAQSLTPLSVNEKLNQAASLKAEDMIANDYFDHWSPSGVSPWYWFAKAGYNFIWAGENLAINFFDTKAVFDAWMNSPSHRDNILSPEYKEIGVAVKSGEINGIQTTVSVLDFGSSKETEPAKSQIAAAPSETSPAQTESGEGQEEEAAPAEAKSEELSEPLQEELATEENKTPQAEQAVSLIQAPIISVLGATTFNFVELAKNVFIYFSLFLIIALAVNILVKIRIQHTPTIILTLILIAISVSLIFI